jgi:GDP-L-fucose synthase
MLYIILTQSTTMMLMKTVLVTGSNGLVGSALRTVSVDTAVRMIFTTRQDMDLCDESQIVAVLQQYKPDIVVHLAANVGGLFKNMDHNLAMFESNMKMNMSLINACRSQGIKKIINMLSTCMFPKDVNGILIEKDIHSGPPHDSNSGYSYAKRTMQIYTELINASDDIAQCINLIPTNIYGLHDNFNLQNAHVVPAIIHKCYNAIQQGIDVLELPGTGTAERMFLHADDLAEVIVDLICTEQFIRGDYIVSGSTSSSITIQKLAQCISSAMNLHCHSLLQITYNSNSGQDGQMKKPCSNAKLLQLYDTLHRPCPIVDNMHARIPAIVYHLCDNYDSIRR